MKVCILAYGCSASFSDSEIMAGLLRESGFEMVDNPEKSDLNVIVTCNVKLPTEKRMINKIKELTRLKKPLIVAGCMPMTQREIIERINPRASLIGPNSIQKIVEVANETLKGKKVVFLEDLKKPKVCLPRVQRNPLIHITQISTGCNRACAYCIVRFNKGSLFCYPTDLIIKDIKDAISQGKKEIWITSQDNASYDFNGKNLASLLEEVCKLDGKFFVRVGMMNPASVKKILEELVEVYENEKIFKFLHLPLQSGSNRILELMNRGYTREEFLEMVKSFRKNLPRITIATDIIVGFPGESERDFEETLEVLEKIKFDIVNISKFGARPLTPASKLKQLDQRIIKERSKKAHELVNRIKEELNEKWVGWEGEVLIDEKGIGNTWVGRNYCYKPIVIESKENILGKFVKVKIKDAKANYLKGVLE